MTFTSETSFEHPQPEGDRLPIMPSILFGVLFGLTANIVAIAMGEPFWVGLVLHGVMGTFGMVLPCFFLWRLGDPVWQDDELVTEGGERR